MRFMDRMVEGASSRLRILAPQGCSVNQTRFGSVVNSASEHTRILHAIQRLRGRVYLQDKAISPSDLDATGRHISPADAQSWHIVRIGPSKIEGCARYRAHRPAEAFAELDSRHAAVARDPLLGGAMRRAVRYAMLENLRSHRDFFEVSGWAIDTASRFSDAAFSVALATYALGRTLGGGCGITTATMRNHSAQILRRLGGRPLECHGAKLPPYFDPRYRCTMELLTFDTALPNPLYGPAIASLADRLLAVPVMCAPTRAARPVEAPLQYVA